MNLVLKIIKPNKKKKKAFQNNKLMTIMTVSFRTRKMTKLRKSFKDGIDRLLNKYGELLVLM